MAITYLSGGRIQGLGEADITGLKAYFTLNESTGDFINTASAIGSTGAISNFDLTASASWAARGQAVCKIDQCPAFGSTSKATADDSNLTDTNFISQTGAEWTICLWLKQNTVAGDAGLYSTSEFYSGEAGLYVRTSTGGGGTGSIQLLCGSVSSPNDRINVISSAVLPNTAWNFLMVQYSDTTGIAKIQINTTVESFTGKNLTNTKTPSDKFQLGNNPAMDNFFNGDMDEVSVWNRILTTAQITDIYNAGVAGDAITTISSLKTPEKDSITNVPVGTRYEETDTRKIFGFRGATSGSGDVTWDTATNVGMTISGNTVTGTSASNNTWIDRARTVEEFYVGGGLATITWKCAQAGALGDNEDMGFGSGTLYTSGDAATFIEYRMHFPDSPKHIQILENNVSKGTNFGTWRGSQSGDWNLASLQSMTIDVDGIVRYYLAPTGGGSSNLALVYTSLIPIARGTLMYGHAAVQSTGDSIVDVTYDFPDSWVERGT